MTVMSMMNMNHKIENPFIDINFDNPTYNTLLEIKRGCAKLEHSILNELEYMSNFNNVCEVNYGVIDNPYKDITRTYSDYRSFLVDILSNLSDTWFIEHIDLHNKEQTFNLEYFLSRDGYGSDFTKLSFTNGTDEFMKAQELYHEAVDNRRELFKGYLGYKKSKMTRIKPGYGNDHHSSHYCKLEFNGEEATEHHWYFNRWDLIQSSNRVTEDEYLEVFKERYPERYI